MRIQAAILSIGLAVAQAQSARAADGPFEPGLLRLAEILGSLHFLETLCKSADTTDWRGEMERLLQSENPEEARRARFVGSFNAGYRAFSVSYSTCTPSAKAAIALYKREGDTLTRDVTARFGN